MRHFTEIPGSGEEGDSKIKRRARSKTKGKERGRLDAGREAVLWRKSTEQRMDGGVLTVPVTAADAQCVSPGNGCGQLWH